MMNTVRLVHFADVHFGMENYGKIDPTTGLNARLLDFKNAFQKIVDYAINQSVDGVLFAGDAYKTREPTPTHQRLFAEGIKQISSAGIPVVMIIGNHDLPGAIGKSHTIDVFKTLQIPNVYVIDRPELVKIPLSSNRQLQVACLPWLTRSQFLTKPETRQLTHDQLNQYITDEIYRIIENFDSQINHRYPAVLMAHGTLEGATFGSERIVELGTDLIIPINVIRKSHFQYVALGHIHQHQTVLDRPLTVYAGSIERIDFGEAHERKGFMSIELASDDQGWRQSRADLVLTQARDFTTIPIMITDADPDPTQTVLAEIIKRKIDNQVVKVIIHCSDHQLKAIREGPIREALQGAFYIAAITRQVVDHGRVKIEQGYSDELIGLQPLDLLEKFLISKNQSKSRIESLKKHALALLDETDSANLTNFSKGI